MGWFVGGFLFGFWAVLPLLIHSAVHRGLDGDGLPENLQALSTFSPFSSPGITTVRVGGVTVPGAKMMGGGRNSSPHCPSRCQRVWEVPPPPCQAVPALCDNFSAHFSCAFLRNSFVQMGRRRSNGNRPRFAESIDSLRSPGPIPQKSASSLNLPLRNARWKRQGCAQEISTNLFLEKNNHFEPCGTNPSWKNYVQEGK